MRYIHVVLFAILVFFALLQWNDPDGLYWAAVYLLAAAWSWIAFRRPGLFSTTPALRIGAPVSIVLFLIGFAWLAPTIGRDWIHVEEAREAFGYLICAATTAFAWWDSRRANPVVA